MEAGGKGSQVLWLLSRPFEGSNAARATRVRCVSAKGLLDPMRGGRIDTCRNLSGTAEASQAFVSKNNLWDESLFSSPDIGKEFPL